MRRLLASILCFLIASTLGLGSVAHASEPVTCVEVSAASGVHVDGDSDQVPADSEKGYPHHHGGCHGHHHAGVPIASEPLEHNLARNLGTLSWEQVHGAGLVGDPALRPPQA